MRCVNEGKDERMGDTTFGGGIRHMCVCVKRISMYTHSDICFHCYREEKEEEHEGEED